MYCEYVENRVLKFPLALIQIKFFLMYVKLQTITVCPFFNLSNRRQYFGAIEIVIKSNLATKDE